MRSFLLWLGARLGFALAVAMTALVVFLATFGIDGIKPQVAGVALAGVVFWAAGAACHYKNWNRGACK